MSKVQWELDLEDAEELWNYLHYNRPGGYQHVHDSLADAIAKARNDSTGQQARHLEDIVELGRASLKQHHPTLYDQLMREEAEASVRLDGETHSFEEDKTDE